MEIKPICDYCALPYDRNFEGKYYCEEHYRKYALLSASYMYKDEDVSREYDKGYNAGFNRGKIAERERIFEFLQNRAHQLRPQRDIEELIKDYTEPL